MDPMIPAPPVPLALPAPAHPISGRKRWIGSLVALAVVMSVGAAAWYLTHRPTQGAEGAGGPGRPGGPGGGGGRGGLANTVGLATAKQADIPVLLDALGTVTPVANVTVRPQVSGVLTRVLFKEGQMVKAGALLATIDPRAYEMALAQAQGARMRDEAQLAAAKVTVQRFRTLLAQDSIARQEVDTQVALVGQLEGTLAIDRANEGTARVNLGYCRITAPMAGRVGLRPVDAGNYIAAGDAGGVAVITQVAPIDVTFSVPQDRVPEIQERVTGGARLPVSTFDRTRTHQLADGVFSTLDNLVDTTTGTLKAKARFANADGRLFPNQFVNVQILLRTISAAVVVPVTALRHGPGGDFVYVLQPDRTVQLRRVTRGDASVENVIIATGLQAGEQVVTEGADRLKDGARVQTSAGAASGAQGGASGGFSGASGGLSGASGAGRTHREGRRASDAGAGRRQPSASAPL
ncbi:MAG: efflux RND transporter periplasmic adaptor subunit [Bacteriovorax sp.]|nr:efflux RND transporter periplasmic adaptor subunit [Rhizobacter sp.]